MRLAISRWIYENIIGAQSLACLWLSEDMSPWKKSFIYTFYIYAENTEKESDISGKCYTFIQEK